MTLRVRGRGVQTALQTMASGILRRELPCESQTLGDGLHDARARCGPATGRLHEAWRQAIAVLELSQACNTLFLHKIGDSMRISCTF